MTQIDDLLFDFMRNFLCLHINTAGFTRNEEVAHIVLPRGCRYVYTFFLLTFLLFLIVILAVLLAVLLALLLAVLLAVLLRCCCCCCCCCLLSCSCCCSSFMVFFFLLLFVIHCIYFVNPSTATYLSHAKVLLAYHHVFLYLYNIFSSPPPLFPPRVFKKTRETYN